MRRRFTPQRDAGCHKARIRKISPVIPRDRDLAAEDILEQRLHFAIAIRPMLAGKIDSHHHAGEHQKPDAGEPWTTKDDAAARALCLRTGEPDDRHVASLHAAGAQILLVGGRSTWITLPWKNLSRFPRKEERGQRQNPGGGAIMGEGENPMSNY